MRILTVNCGSSSLKCSLVDPESGAIAFEHRVEEIENDGYAAAMAAALDALDASGAARPDAVAHRIVHGGEAFASPVIVDATVLPKLQALGELAPLHNPPALAALEIARSRLSVPHVAIFDTSFHATLPPRAREYALPREVRERYGVRRFGFHGISHAHVMRTAAGFLSRPATELRIISCHLGNGASVTAIEYGRSVETSMGMTPLEGLVMGSRAGDLDPGALVHLLRAGYDVSRLDALLNHESGLRGLAGTNDVREIEQRAAQGDEGARLALTLYAHRIRKYIGAYAAVMGGVDVIAFTGGVGEHSALIRNRSLQRLDFLGARLDDDLNRDATVDDGAGIARISDATSRVTLLVIRADEALEMARAAASLSGRRASPVDRRVPVAVSARHAHLSRATLDAIFGAGHALEPHAELHQHGQFAANEVVTLVGPRGRIEHVRVMGPPRAEDQVEISRTDEFVLGIDAPVRLSGDLANTPGITVVGPKGSVNLTHGVVCARRHIHMNPTDAARLGLADHATVAVRIDSAGRDLTFNDVTVRIAPDFALELHLDTDEANAAGVTPGMTGEILL